MFERASSPHRVRGQERGTTAFLRHGRTSPVVLIHGVGMNASIWAPQMEALSRHHDVIAYDMLGHGGSSLPMIDARLSDYADQLLSLVDELALEPAHLIGHSMGALVALEFALAHPERVRSVVALNGVYCRSPEQKRAVQNRASGLEGAAESTDSSDGTIARWFGDPIPSKLLRDAERVRELLRLVNRDGYARTYRLFASSDEAHRDALARLSVPALFMTGELDPNSTPEMSRAMAAASPLGRSQVVPGARLMMPLTAIEEVNDRLLAFLGSVEAASSSDNSMMGASA